MSRSREDIFRLWAPAASPWATWAKPVLFTHLPASLEGAAIEPFDCAWAPPAEPADTAIVVDLPALASVAAGVALAQRGYQPAPLFNAVPGPRMADSPSSTFIGGPSVAVNLWPAMRAIVTGTEQLAAASIAWNAPPVFLLDADRRVGQQRRLGPGDFDNRSISFGTDFPSSSFLLSHGIRRIVLVQRQPAQPQADLAQTLRRWQDAGVQMSRYATDAAAGIQPFIVDRPRWYRAFWHHVLAALHLRRHVFGGYGGKLPEVQGSAG
jgi:hypothetical protein